MISIDEIFQLDSRRSIVALVSAAMTCCAFASLVSSVFVVNRRCWVIPCARHAHGSHTELLGLRVRSGDAFSCISSASCSLLYAYASFRMFAVDGRLSTGKLKFEGYKGVTLGMVLILLQQSTLWMEETGTVGAFVHRGAKLLNSNGNNGQLSPHGGIPNIYLLHAMQSLAIFSTLSFLLCSGLAWCIFHWEDDLVASNEYSSIPDSSFEDREHNGADISIPVIESPILQRRMAAKKKKKKKEVKHKAKRNKKRRHSRGNSAELGSEVDSEEDFGNLEKELELGGDQDFIEGHLQIEEDIGVVDL